MGLPIQAIATGTQKESNKGTGDYHTGKDHPLCSKAGTEMVLIKRKKKEHSKDTYKENGKGGRKKETQGRK